MRCALNFSSPGYKKPESWNAAIYTSYISLTAAYFRFNIQWDQALCTNFSVTSQKLRFFKFTFPLRHLILLPNITHPSTMVFKRQLELSVHHAEDFFFSKEKSSAHHLPGSNKIFFTCSSSIYHNELKFLCKLSLSLPVMSI